MTGSLRAYAKHRKEAGLIGGSLSAVQKALATCRITKGSDGKIEFERADRDWEANLNQHKARGPKADSTQTAAEFGAPAGSPAGESGIPAANFLEAQRQHEWLKVQKEALELEVRRGKLIDVSEVENTWGSLLSTFRNRLMLLPDKIAPRVAHTSDVLECRAIVEREVREALTTLSEYQSNAA